MGGSSPRRQNATVIHMPPTPLQKHPLWQSCLGHVVLDACPKGRALTPNSHSCPLDGTSELSRTPRPGADLPRLALFPFMASWTDSCLKGLFFPPPFFCFFLKEDADAASDHPGFQSTAGGQKGKSPIKLLVILTCLYKKAVLTISPIYCRLSFHPHGSNNS